jgi:hypothetical protein
MTITASVLRSFLAMLPDAAAALENRLANVPDDEALAADALAAAVALDPALMPLEIVLPGAEWFAEWFIAHNRSAEPDAQMPIDYGRRGSDPNLPTGEDAT